MKKVMALCAIMTMMGGVSSVASAGLLAASQAGGDRLVALQNDDGGWDWPLDDGNPANTSPKNTVGPIAMGLAQAYLRTNDPDHSAALQNAGSLLLGKSTNFSPSDGYLAWQLDAIFGGTTYSSHVKSNFYDQLAAGTYNRNGAGTLYNTAQYVQLIRDSRQNAGAGNMAAWDVGMGLYAASLQSGVSTADWVAGVKGEIDELDDSGYYDVIGLAGAIMGLASVGENYDPIAGEHVAASNIADLADILVGYQLNTGGFTWNSAYVIEGDDNETVQETSYAILALMELDESSYASPIQQAQDYLISIQLANGGWNDWAGGSENNEITGEALWAIPEPATMGLLGLGALSLIRKKRQA